MIASILAGVVRLFTGVQARWAECRPETTQRVYFANHTSHMDFLVLWSALPTDVRLMTRPVAAADYWRKGRMRRYLASRVFNAVLIERENITRANNPVVQLVEVLKGGDSIIIFPEGGRTTEPEIRPFKSGLYHIAKAVPTVELIPVFLDNASRVLPKGEFLPIPFLCSATFGHPMRLDAGESRDSFLARAHMSIKAMAG